MNVIPQRVKDGFVRLMGPLARGLIQAGVPPNTITTLGTLVVLGSGLAFGTGSIRLGGLLLLVSGVFDILDGQVARQGGKTTTFGAFYDSTLDRVGEAAVFTGLIQAGVPPNTITTLGTLVVLGSGLAFGTGSIRLGGLLLLVSGVFDILDGQVARQGGKTTTFGAFYDSTLDRVGEAAVFTGLI